MQSHVLVAEGIAEAGQKILADAGVSIVTPADSYDPQSIIGIIVRSVFRVDRTVLAQFPCLRIVAKLGTGMDNIDEAVCRAAGVAVVSAPGMNSVSTAEFTVMQILALWKNAYEIRDRVRQHDYRRAVYHGRELVGATAGVIGYGSVGKHVVERLRPFVQEVLVYDRAQASRCAIEVGNVRFVTERDALLPTSDILILAVTLAGNERMVDASLLERVRSDVLLVNMARGGLVDEPALLAFLRTHPEAHYASDVLTEEPDYTLPPERQRYRSPLLELPNVTYTPHIACLTPECQERIAVTLAEQVVATLAAPTTMVRTARTISMV